MISKQNPLLIPIMDSEKLPPDVNSSNKLVTQAFYSIKCNY